MKCSVYIATSADGFIAKSNGSVDWLHTCGNLTAEMGEDADMGFALFMASVDCMIMGRKTMEIISNMKLTPEQWPYGDTRIIVLSHKLKELPGNISKKMELYSGDIKKLVKQLEEDGHKRAYIDGGTTIRSFLNLQLIDDMTITRAPILLGDGIPLFCNIKTQIKLHNSSARAFPNDFIQEYYKVSYVI